MQVTVSLFILTQQKTKKEWEIEFKLIYIDILKKVKSYDELAAINEDCLNQFKSEYTIDNNSIEFLPAYFNFIECFLAQNDKIGEVKKYLIVGLTNLLNASKKKDESSKYRQEYSTNEYDEEEVNKKLLQSRLDLLFARFNILTRAPNEAIEKLTSSIITYSEIYGPENVGLTPQYYYLADYFLDMGMGDDKKEKRRKIVVKNIYLKIADMWKMYFLGMVNPLFLSNDDQDLILAIGETYVKLIANRIGSTFRDSETELELKFKMIKVIILKRTNSDIYEKALENVLDLKKKIEDKIIDKEYIEEMAEEMKN